MVWRGLKGLREVNGKIVVLYDKEEKSLRKRGYDNIGGHKDKSFLINEGETGVRYKWWKSYHIHRDHKGYWTLWVKR